MDLPPTEAGQRPLRPRSTYQAIARNLGDRLLALMRPIRILDAIRWPRSIEESFLAHGGRQPPAISAASYLPLPFEPAAKRRELIGLEREVRTALGRGDPIGQLMVRRCRQARAAVELLKARGTSEFARLSAELYGRPTDAENAAVNAVIAALSQETSPFCDRTISTAAAIGILAARLDRSLARGSVSGSLERQSAIRCRRMRPIHQAPPRRPVFHGGHCGPGSP